MTGLLKRGMVIGQAPDAQMVATEFCNISTFINFTLPTPVAFNVGFSTNSLINYMFSASATATESYIQTPWSKILKNDGTDFTGFLDSSNIIFPQGNQAWNLRLVLFGQMTNGNQQRGKVTFYIPTVPGGTTIDEELSSKYIGDFAPDPEASSFTVDLTTRVSPIGNLLANGLKIAYIQQDGNFTVNKMTILIGN